MSQAKGSLRCVLDLVSSTNFVTQLNPLIISVGAKITKADNWMPISYANDKEAELKDFLTPHFSNNLGAEIANWWLAISTSKSRTPNWDIVSTCTINGKKGILLVEAKAHFAELEGEVKGKPLAKDASDNSIKNHKQIGAAIAEANDAINRKISGVSISRDKCYQISNRVAHAWWIANKGIPVVLLYLGFLNAEDMKDSYTVFNTSADWENCFLNHAKKVGVDNIINKWVDCGKSSFITICGGI